MKQILFILIAFISFGLSNVNAQSTTTSYFTDTISNTTPEYHQVGSLTYPFYYQVNVVTDSLTGSTDGAITLEHLAAPQGVTDTANWIVVNTLVLNGATQQTAIWSGYQLSGKLRVKALGVGTMTQRVRTSIARIRKTL